jgi:spermidine/putrescine transport system permease protein
VPRDSTKASSRSWRTLFLLAPTWLTLGGLFLIPLLLLFWISLFPPDDFGNAQAISDWHAYLHSGVIFQNYADSLQPLFLSVQLRSLWLAIFTTILCLLIGYPVAYFIAIVAPPRRKNFLLALAVIPFWTSFLIRIAAWRLILQDQGLINLTLLNLHLIHQPIQMLDTSFAVMIGLIYGELPFMILPIYASLEKLDRTLLEASGDLGAGPTATFFRVTVPLTMPGILAGIVLVFIPGIGQFIVSDMLGGARTALIGNMIQDQFTSGRNKPLGAAMALELTVMVLAILAAYVIYARRRGGVEL